MNATGIALWIGIVVGLVELLKFGGVPPRFGLLACALLSMGAVSVEIAVDGFTVAMLREYVSGWAAILFAAAGVYGFVRNQRAQDVTSMERRP
jgi:hypothetical protein